MGGANHKDFHAMPHGGDPGSSNTAVRSGRRGIVSTSSTSDEEAAVQLQILQELRKVTTRLDKVEEQVAVVKTAEAATLWKRTVQVK